MLTGPTVNIGANCMRSHQFMARTLGAIALLSAHILVPSAASAQDSTLSTDAQVGLLRPLTILKLSDLDFGDLIVTTGGTVVLAPTDTATCTTTGGVIHSGECEAATFAGLGITGQRVRVRRPNGRRITLTGPGADMTVTDITILSDSTLTPTRSNPQFERFLINSANGAFFFRIGGTLNVNPNQAGGLYTGTFEVRLDYQ